MKIITVMGSPRPKGNTEHVLKIFETILEKDHEIVRINVRDHDIQYCQGCFTCKGTSEIPGCPIKDDMPGLFGQIIDADLIVYASPLYGKSCTAQLKTFLDRQYALVNFTDWVKPETTSLMAGTPTAFLVTCGGPDDEFNTAIIRQQIEVFNKVMKTRDLGLFLLPHCIMPDQIGERGQRIALDLARAVDGIG